MDNDEFRDLDMMGMHIEGEDMDDDLKKSDMGDDDDDSDDMDDDDEE